MNIWKVWVCGRYWQHEQTSSVMALGTSLSLSEPRNTSTPSGITSKCPHLCARPPMLSGNELPSSPVSPPRFSFCATWIHVQSWESWGSKPSCLFYDFVSSRFHSSVFLLNSNCPNSNSLPKPHFTEFPPHETFFNLSPTTLEIAFCFPFTSLAICTSQAMHNTECLLLSPGLSGLKLRVLL